MLALLLAAVGLIVTEIALWGRRQATSAARRSGYVDGILQVLRNAPDDRPVEARRQAICAEITRVLGLDGCTYAAGAPAGGWPQVDDTGVVRWGGRSVDVARQGLPTDAVIAVPVRTGGQIVGHFRMVAATRSVYARPEQLKVAVLLAGQAA